MRSTLYQCDLCAAEIQGEMAVFLFNDIALTPEFQNVPVKKRADFCKECAEKVKTAIDKIGQEVKVEEIKEQNTI